MLENKKVIVTGGGGFLGRYVCEELRRFGSQVFPVRQKDYDLREKSDIERLFRDNLPDIVIHGAAACGGVKANKENPGRFFYDNAIMGIQLIEQSRRFNVEKLVLIGTVCSYPKSAPVPFLEETLWDGYPEDITAPYGLAKKMLCAQSMAYRQQYGFNSVSLLLTNLYGPHDNFGENFGVVSSLIARIRDAKVSGKDKIEIWGDGRVSRDFLHVRDAARGIVLAVENLDKSEPVNLGTGQETPIAVLAADICEIFKFDGELVWNSQCQDGESRRCCDVQKAKEFGFEAKISLAEGLNEMVDWYEKYLLSNK